MQERTFKTTWAIVNAMARNKALLGDKQVAFAQLQWASKGNIRRHAYSRLHREHVEGRLLDHEVPKPLGPRTYERVDSPTGPRMKWTQEWTDGVREGYQDEESTVATRRRRRRK